MDTLIEKLEKAKNILNKKEIDDCIKDMKSEDDHVVAEAIKDATKLLGA